MEDCQYIYHTDPGHGWLEVDQKDINELGIADKISSYSYMNKTKVYLEEDCDMTLFIEAFKTKFDAFPIVIELSTNQHSRIRNFNPYKNGF